jgi:hypothetical protein
MSDHPFDQELKHPEYSALEVNANDCGICGEPIDKDDLTNWLQVSGFVHGPKRDGLALRAYTGLQAHDECIKKAIKGQGPDQPELF